MDFDFINYLNSMFGNSKDKTKSKEEIIQELDSLYWRDRDTYLRKLSITKITYKVFRNEAGKHRLQVR